MVQLLDFGEVTPDAAPAAQQLAIIACLYQNRRDLVEQLLGADGEVLVWHWFDYSYPPSWCVIRSGAGRYFVVWSGTTSISHWAVHVSGLRGTPGGIVGGTVNYAWYRVWEGYMRDEIRAHIDAAPGPTSLHFSGHSYGAALAHIAAVEEQARYPALKVECLTFAQPKTYLGGQESRQPSKLYRLRSYYDAVPYTPPERKYFALLQFIPAVSWTNLLLKWQHYGIDYWIGPGGRFGVGEEAPDPLPPGVAVGIVSEHYTRNYWGRLLAHYTVNGGPPEMAAALAIADIALTAPDAQRLAPDLSPFVLGPSLEEVPIPFDGIVPDDDSDGASSMAATYPAPLTGGRIMQALIFINAKDGGWDEGFHLHHNNTGDPYIAAAQWLQSYIDIRRKVLSNKATIDYLRISDISIRGDAFVRVKPDIGMGPGLVSGFSGSPNDGWQLTLGDETRTVRANRQLRGWPDALLASVMELGVHQRPVSPLTVAFLTAVTTLLTNALPVPNNGTITPVIRSLSKNPAVGRQWEITHFGVDATGRLKVTIVPSAFTIGQGETLYVTHKRTLGVTGVNGTHVVVAADFSVPQPVITFADRPPVDITELDGVTGSLARREVQDIPIKFVDILRASYRQTGRPSAGSRGRRRRK